MRKHIANIGSWTRYLCLFWLSLSSALVLAAPSLHGVSAHKELNRDVFLGALYSDVKTNSSSDLLNSTNKMRMELRIVSNAGLSKRRFARMWIEGVAVNNPNSDLSRSAEDLFAFTKLFDSKLANGDIVTIETTRDKPVVTHNGIKVGELANNKLFTLLLSTWLGEVPVSADFKSGLLDYQNIDQKVLMAYNAVTPSKTRIDAIASFVESSPEVPDVAAVETPAKPKAAPKPEKKAVKKPVAKKTPKPKKKEPKPKPKKVAKTPTKKDIPANVKPPKAAPKAPAVRVATVTAPTRPVKKAEANDGDMTVESLLSSQRYFNQMNARVKTKVVYPEVAKKRQQEGTVKVVVIIDRNGKLLRAEPIVETRYNMLNKEAVNAVKRAAPFPRVPASMRGNRHEFNVPVVFKAK